MAILISRDDFFLPPSAPFHKDQIFLVFDEDAEMGPTVHTYGYRSHDENEIVGLYQGASFLPNDEEHDWEGAGVSIIMPPFPSIPTHHLRPDEPGVIHFRARLAEDSFWGDPEVEKLICTKEGLEILIDWIKNIVSERDLKIPAYGLI